MFIFSADEIFCFKVKKYINQTLLLILIAINVFMGSFVAHFAIDLLNSNRITVYFSISFVMLVFNYLIQSRIIFLREGQIMCEHAIEKMKVCVGCKGQLVGTDKVLRCSECGNVYKLNNDGVWDFRQFDYGGQTPLLYRA